MIHNFHNNVYLHPVPSFLFYLTYWEPFTLSVTNRPSQCFLAVKQHSFFFHLGTLCEVGHHPVGTTKEKIYILIIIGRNCYNVMPLRDSNDYCMWPPHHWQAFADNSRNKDLADGQSGLLLSFSITTWQRSNPTWQHKAIQKGKVLFTTQGYAAQEDVYSSCGKQL